MSKKFEAMAELYVEKIKNLDITDATLVRLVFHCCAADGRAVPPIRQSVAPAAHSPTPFQTDLARRFALALRVGTICDNIRKHLRGLQRGGSFTATNGEESVPVVVHDVLLEVEEPEQSKTGERGASAP